jgi:hypothetical protein
MDLLGLLACTALGESSKNNKKRKFPSYFSDHFITSNNNNSNKNEDGSDNNNNNNNNNKKQNVSQNVKRWCLFEHFYSSIDLNYFADNEFVSCLKLIGFNHINTTFKSQWTKIRREMGKQIGQPRRLSKHFLKTERDKLEVYRQTMRLSHSGRSFQEDEYFMYPPSEPLQVADRVALYVPKSQEFHQGTILSIIRSSNPAESSQYLVQFDESSEQQGRNVVPPMLVYDIHLTVLTENSETPPKPSMSPKMYSIQPPPMEEQSQLELKMGSNSHATPLSPGAIQDMLTTNILTQKPEEEATASSLLAPFQSDGKREMDPNHLFSRYSQEDSLPLHGVFSQRSNQSVFSLGQYDEDETKVLASQPGFSQSSWLDHMSIMEASRWTMTSGTTRPPAVSFLQTVASSRPETTRPPAGARSVAISPEDILDKVWRDSERVSDRIVDASLAKLEVIASGDIDIESSNCSNNASQIAKLSLQNALFLMEGNDELRTLLVKLISGIMMLGHNEVRGYGKDTKMKFWVDKLVDFVDNEEKEMMMSAYTVATNALKLLW